MPTLFDSHEEFNEWFSKDIESHAENKSTIDQSKLLFSLPVLVYYQLELRVSSSINSSTKYSTKGCDVLYFYNFRSPF